MFVVEFKGVELFNNETSELERIPPCSFIIEHSLIAISKWESKWKKPFISDEDKTLKEIKDYIKCMTITQNVDQRVYDYLPDKTVRDIVNYMEDPHTAYKTKKDVKNQRTMQTITSDKIYSYMVALRIPFETQKWHIQRLLLLIDLCNKANQPQKKQSKAESLANRDKINKERRAKLGTKG